MCVCGCGWALVSEQVVAMKAGDGQAGTELPKPPRRHGSRLKGGLHTRLASALISHRKIAVERWWSFPMDVVINIARRW